MPNAQVLKLLRDAHVALLPTYDDTYGFSVLEAQASGTPVITTNVCALEEINNDAVGWVVRLSKDEWGQAAGINSGGTAEISGAIRAGVYAHLRAILDDPASLRGRAVACLDRIQADHDPERYATHIRTIYAGITGR
jgi:glycosyltransferase involved in cell wall biosynthesis